MQLPNLFGRKAAPDHFFLSLFLADGVLQAGLWAVQNNQVVFLEHSGPRHYDLPEAALPLVDEAFQELGPDSEKATKVVFGFEPSWIDHSGVHAQRKAFLRRLTTELNLEPVGFVSLTESVIQQLLVRDALFSAIVMLFHGSHVFGFLCKQGKVLAQVDIGRADDVIVDAKELLARLSKQAVAADHYLPPQILLASTAADDANLVVHQQHLLGHQWTPEYPFVQSPTIELLPGEFVIEAITHQGGLAVAKANGLITAASQIQARPLENNFASILAAGATMSPPETPEATPQEQTNLTEPTVATSFGVPVSSGLEVSPAVEAALEEEAAELMPPPVDAIPVPPDSFVAFPHSRHPFTIKKIVAFSVVAGLVTVLLAGYLGIWLLYKTQVLVQVDTGTVAKEVKITLDSKAAASDPENLVLKADLLKKEVSGSDTLATTGVKLVGEKASGVVMIANKTVSVKMFPKGTELSAGSIKFVLQNDTQVASATATATALEFSQTEAKVTAVDIGAQANLAKDMALKIAAFDTNTYSATVKEGLTGGASREVRVVSIEDRQKLQKTLTEELTKKATDAFKQDSTDGTFVIPTGKIIQTTPKFDAEIGKETDELGLALTTQFEGLVYSREDLQPLLTQVLGSEIPPGYQLAEADPQLLSSTETAPAASGSAKVVLNANVSATTEAIVDPATLRQELAGLSLAQAESKLKTTPTIKQSQVQFNPSLARWLVGRLPNQIDRIEITVQRP